MSPPAHLTELKEPREIADYMITRLQQFLDGERDLANAVTVVEWVVEVEVFPEGAMVDAEGNVFGMDGERGREHRTLNAQHRTLKGREASGGRR